MSQLTDVIEFATASVSVDQAKRRVYIAADEYQTGQSEWRSILAYLRKHVGNVRLSDQFEYVPGGTQFVCVGAY